MRRRLVASAVAALAALIRLAAEAPAEEPSVTVLATGHLDSVVELPVFFRLYRVYVPAGRHVVSRGASALLYDMRGSPEIELEGTAPTALAEGDGAFVEADRKLEIGAAEAVPADLLLFVLSARPNQKPPFDPPAVVRELFRTGDPLPGLQSGAYDFVLTRVLIPAGTPAAVPHYRTGAAVTHILSGTGSLIAEGKTEPMPAGNATAELSGWFHQWANPGDAPVVMLRASLDPEGAPATVPESAQ